MEYLIKQYGLQQGALEIQYIEEFFLDFPRKKIGGRGHHPSGRSRSPDPHGGSAAAGRSVVGHAGLVQGRPRAASGRERSEAGGPGRAARGLRATSTAGAILYQWIGGTRSDWRGQGHFRALTEEQEVWAIDNGFDEIIVKTKNKFYEMRSTLAQLNFDVIRFVPHPFDIGESKVFLSKRLGQHVLDAHRSRRTVTRTG